MTSIVIIGCYFGNLRKDTPVFLKSIEINPTIDWLIFSDCDWGNVPSNVKVVDITFEKLKELIQSKFDFKICLDAPYKLCDFKPAYGEIFQEYIADYNFWGHTDFDLVYGDLRKFFTEDKLKKFERIYYQGHLSLYRNTEKTNKLYRSQKGKQYFKEVFSVAEIKVFDEVDGMYPIFINENVPIYSEVEYIDVYPYLNVMLHPRKEHDISTSFPKNMQYQIFGYDNGRVFKWYKEENKMKEQEYAYIHFSHKSFSPIESENFYFTSNGLVPRKGNEEIPFERYYKGIDELRMNAAELWFRVKRKIAKMTRR